MNDLQPKKDPKGGQHGGIRFNGNGLANATGKQLLQIIPINIVAIVAIIGAAVGLYYKLEARITSLEQNPRFGMTLEEKNALLGRVAESERELKDLGPRIIETHTNVLWLMNQQKSANPR